MARRMRDPDFVAEMKAGALAPHIAPVNKLVNALRKERPQLSMPYVAPHYDATKARVLSLLSNPGPRADGEAGSGFLSVENDDSTAERLGALYHRVGLSETNVLPWNAFPWFVHEAHPNGLPLEFVLSGQDALHRLLQVATGVRAVVAHGGDAHRAVRAYARDPERRQLIEQRQLRFWETRHTGDRAFSADVNERERRLEEVAGVYWDAMSWAGLDSTWSTGVAATTLHTRTCGRAAESSAAAREERLEAEVVRNRNAYVFGGRRW